jgi:hypothetical protein
MSHEMLQFFVTKLFSLFLRLLGAVKSLRFVCAFGDFPKLSSLLRSLVSSFSISSGPEIEFKQMANQLLKGGRKLQFFRSQTIK